MNELRALDEHETEEGAKAQGASLSLQITENHATFEMTFEQSMDSQRIRTQGPDTNGQRSPRPPYLDSHNLLDVRPANWAV